MLISATVLDQWLTSHFQGNTSELLKDIITIFYSPLAQVYKAANIAESIGDLQTFANDLIKTVESVDECEFFVIRHLCYPTLTLRATQ